MAPDAYGLGLSGTLKEDPSRPQVRACRAWVGAGVSGQLLNPGERIDEVHYEAGGLS